MTDQPMTAQRCALVDRATRVVVNVVFANSDSPCDDLLIPSDTAVIGALWDGAAFTGGQQAFEPAPPVAPAPTSDQLKAALSAAGMTDKQVSSLFAAAASLKI